MNNWALTLLPLLILCAAYQCEQKNVPGNCCKATCLLTKAMKKTAAPGEVPMERSEKIAVDSVAAVKAFTKEKKLGWLRKLLKSLFPDLEPQIA